jgi:hypothetical protein
MDLIEHALRYEQLGWYVLPVHPTEKRPLVKWAGRKNQRPTPMEIKGWWRKWPTCRIGIATGSLSGIDVVDLDGPDAFEKCISLCGGLPDTVSQITGRPEGGRHLFFKHDEHGLKNQACGGLDLRTDGGMVVVAPSAHHTCSYICTKGIVTKSNEDEKVFSEEDTFGGNLVDILKNYPFQFEGDDYWCAKFCKECLTT